MDKVIITVAVVGNQPTREHHPRLPITPKEIANSAIESYKSGASICHIHARDPETGRPSMKLDLYREVVERIRGETDMLINLTTGSGGRIVFDPELKEKMGDAGQVVSPERRVEHVLELKPELCSLDVGSMSFGRWIFANALDHVETMAKLIKEAGTKPELEVFDTGHVSIARHLIDKGLVERPPLFQLCMGIRWGIPATPENLVAMRSQLPEDAIWFAFGPGRHEFTMVTMAVLMGGHARVGFEDNLHIRRGVLAESNAELVRWAAEMIRLLGKEVATPEDTRKILGLGDRAGRKDEGDSRKG